MPIKLTEEFLRELSGGGVELLTHGDTAVLDFILHLDVLQETRCDGLQGIFWPSLSKQKQKLPLFDFVL